MLAILVSHQNQGFTASCGVSSRMTNKDILKHLLGKFNVTPSDVDEVLIVNNDQIAFTWNYDKIDEILAAP